MATSEVLGITMGDASGVGPEIILKASKQGALPFPFVVFGDLSVLSYCNDLLGYGLTIKTVQSPEEVLPGVVSVIDLHLLDQADITPGKISAKAGAAALQYVLIAVQAALAGSIRAMVTLPMNKAATRRSASGFTGHTEVISAMCGVPDYSMTLISDQLIVSHVSSHVSLRHAIGLVKKDRILRVIELTNAVALKLGRNRKLAIMGLNPHAGEGGAFGQEDVLEIAPAVEGAWELGIDAVGPLPPDTVFLRALKGEFGSVVCMYHDQGHIPMKTIGFEDAVNVTVGLPIVRTSVDHGTAFDIAYEGKASIGSFQQSCELALRLSAPAE